MAKTLVTLSYQGMSYTFTGDDVVFRGALACDCLKCRLIQSHCDRDFPMLGCGTAVEVIEFREVSVAA